MITDHETQFSIFNWLNCWWLCGFFNWKKDGLLSFTRTVYFVYWLFVHLLCNGNFLGYQINKNVEFECQNLSEDQVEDGLIQTVYLFNRKDKNWNAEDHVRPDRLQSETYNETSVINIHREIKFYRILIVLTLKSYNTNVFYYV